MPVRERAVCIRGQITEGYTDQLLREAGQPDGCGGTAAGRSTAQRQAGYLYRTLQDGCRRGILRWVKVIGQTFYDEKGEPERVLGKVCDIDDAEEKGVGTAGKISERIP